MRQDIAFQWADALKSGRYKQTTGKLYRPAEDGYCCLGVLADMLGELDKDTGQIIGTRETGVLTPELRDHVGMFAHNGETRADTRIEFGNGRTSACLASANDKGATFPEIAKFIRENWEVL